jgi:hypothetical protein
VILRDANGFNVSNGKLESAGIEWDLGWTPFEGNRLSVIGTYARTHVCVRSHGYRRRSHQRRPRRRYCAALARQRALDVSTDAEHRERSRDVYQGKYYLDAASTANYDGFTLWNWRGSWQARRIGGSSRA